MTNLSIKVEKGANLWIYKEVTQLFVTGHSNCHTPFVFFICFSGSPVSGMNTNKQTFLQQTHMTV